MIIKETLILGMGILVGMAAGVCYWIADVKNHAIAIPSPVAVHANPATVIGPNPTYLGTSGARYTIVEFGDYECAPCHTANTAVENYILHHKSRIRFTFRNFPLTKIHPHAMAAAQAAELARAQGRFWPFHDVLYTAARIDDATIRHCAQAVGLADRKAASIADANRAVTRDQEDGKRLDVNGTPSFFLCTPGGKVMQVFDISQVDRYLQ